MRMASNDDLYLAFEVSLGRCTGPQDERIVRLARASSLWPLRLKLYVEDETVYVHSFSQRMSLQRGPDAKGLAEAHQTFLRDVSQAQWALKIASAVGEMARCGAEPDWGEIMEKVAA